ncbi:MAG TPA: carbohydrate-binding module family 20 domain-containing protein [Bacteroidota bacterium]|nr:carbohydrate-binding module family 20 domain-containing protein [Bacteroidota bacterium]
MNDTYPESGGTLYVNLIWHQHQPLYLDPGSDQLQGPWVRTHATKDYYDMASILEKYPDVHYNVNLTSSLLFQLEKYYVERLKPFVDLTKNRVNAKAFFKKWKGKTDPWIDLALKPTAAFDSTDLAFMTKNTWNAFGIGEVQIRRFPAYLALKELSGTKHKFTEQELRDIKFWFYLAHFDPDFLEHRNWLADGTTIDLTDLVAKHTDGTYHLKKEITEDDCNRIIAETYKICANVIPIHKKLMYNHISHHGQIEVATTPFFHPILPLVYDSDVMGICQPNDPKPPRYHFPEDANAQVAMAVRFYTDAFGQPPLGMWPGEGSVSHEVIPIFAANGIQWIATDEKILSRSKPYNQEKFYPYHISTDGGRVAPVALCFRETELSDKIGFTYKKFQGEQAADDFIRSVLRYAPKQGEPERLLTVILDGENAWEWYEKDNDGKEFLHALYRKLNALYATRQIVTVTMSEYIHGNPLRAVAAHPVEMMKKLDWLYPGSWINANYDTWIGEDEENRAWTYLLQARQDLASSGIKQPDPKAKEPKPKTKKWYGYKAWEAMYAAEGSDWFWWYGTDQNAPAGDKPFDIAFITHLKNLYAFGNLAGGTFPARVYKQIITTHEAAPERAQGTMARSKTDMISVVFQCDAQGIYVRKGIFIAGNTEELGNWTPNVVKLYDDGTHGDQTANDGIWSIEFQFQVGTVLEYKYTNSGAHGEWIPGEEFASNNRRVTIDGSTDRIVLLDTFGHK